MALEGEYGARPALDQLNAASGAHGRRLDLQIRDLVRSLLSFARKSGGRLGPIALSASMQVAVDLRSAAYAQAGERLLIDVALTLYVDAEMQKLQHVIVYVVNNALDAMAADHGTTLRISAFVADSGWVHVVFEDDAPGFVDVRAAFQPFYTTKPAERGTGLGLALTQKFVHEFGGSVFAENREEGGAGVTIVLRHAVAATTEESGVSTPHPKGPPPKPEVIAEIAPSLTADENGEVRPRVLVVDDEPSLRQIQRRLLALENVDVLLASNADEAREILSANAVDLVISDLRMPGAIDGRGLIAWIAEHQPHLSQRILIVTGDLNGLSTDSETGIPPEQVLSKPFTRQEYVSRVRAALDRDA